MKAFYLMQNEVQHYAWGSIGKNAFIPRLLQLSNIGDKPYAELWMGTHPNAPSRCAETGRLLSELIRENPEAALGNALAAGSSSLPFLAKILSVSGILSIQLHPAEEDAVHLHQKDPEHYPDRGEKAEIAVALEPLQALAAFPDPPQLKTIIQSYESLHFLLEELDFHKKRLEIHRNISSKIIEITRTPELLDTLLQDLKREILGKPTQNDNESLFLKLFDSYASDAGLIFVLLLEYHQLEPGEALYLKPGEPHAYISGNLIEAMVNSDNVIRVGLTPKFKDPENMLNCLRSSDSSALLSPLQNRYVKSYIPDTEAFRIHLIEMNCAEMPWNGLNNPAVFLCLKGEYILQSQQDVLTVQSGQSVFIAAETTEFIIKSKKDSQAVLYQSAY